MTDLTRTDVKTTEANMIELSLREHVDEKLFIPDVKKLKEIALETYESIVQSAAGKSVIERRTLLMEFSQQKQLILRDEFYKLHTQALADKEAQDACLVFEILWSNIEKQCFRERLTKGLKIHAR